ncbi:GGDEF domain-containing protein [Sulfurimonas sp.]|uniref:GGDEF domain-containing protein n=1 Tax=Sulfurimonas sp. TaxID=2022749 RepID=UPI0035688F45
MNKHRISKRIIILLFVHIFVVLLTYLAITYIQNSVKHDAMIINKIGQIRGGIQKEAKEFMYANTNTAYNHTHINLEDKINEIIDLCNVDFPTIVPLIKNIAHYRDELEIYIHKNKDTLQRDKIDFIFSKSEELWKLTNQTVLEIQKIAEKKQNNLRYIYYALYIELLLLVYLIYIIYINVNKTLEHKNLELNILFDIAPDITLVTTGEGLIKANDKFFAFTGFDSVEKFKIKYDCICDMFDNRKGYLSKVVDGKKWTQYILDNPNEVHKALILQNGIEYIFDVSVKEFNVKGEKKSIVVLRNITLLEKLFTTDQLTQINNRKKTEEFIQYCIDDFKRNHNKFSIILLDIDYFKTVNDTYGHDLGDLILKEFSNIIKDNIRKIDMLGRWGGEEFMIICTNTDVKNAEILAEKIRKKIEEYDFEIVKNMTASFGVAQYSENLDFSSLFKHADEALYLAKNNGRNRVETV